MQKKIIQSILLLVLILIVGNWVYTRYFYEKDLQKYSDVINLVRAIPDSTDILYIGESSNITFRENDIDKRPISAFIGDFYPTLHVADITKPASHAGIYKYLLANVAESCQAQTVIVTLNLRSFNAQWIESNLETPLQRSMVLLRNGPPLYKRMMLSFKDYDIKSDKEREQRLFEKWERDIFEFPYPFPHRNVREWDYWMAHSGIKAADGNFDYKATELACHYIKAYGFQLDTVHNPRIKDFKELLQLAKERNWNIVMNLMAENTEKAQKLVGDDLLFLMEENRKKLISFFTQRGVPVVDNLHLVGDKEFIDQDWTTEHYAEGGRKAVAKQVAIQIQRYHKAHFREVVYQDTKQVAFFNNCDQNIIWGQMQTLNSHVAYSGQNSSFTGKDQPFSLTFEYPLKNIPYEAQNKIIIDCKIWQSSTHHNTQLVLQGAKDEAQCLWLGEPVQSQIKQVNSWQDFHFEYQIEPQVKNADLIKIYLYNTSETAVYLDDFHIRFE